MAELSNSSFDIRMSCMSYYRTHVDEMRLKKELTARQPIVLVSSCLLLELFGLATGFHLVKEDFHFFNALCITLLLIGPKSPEEV